MVKKNTINNIKLVLNITSYISLTLALVSLASFTPWSMLIGNNGTSLIDDELMFSFVTLAFGLITKTIRDVI